MKEPKMGDPNKVVGGDGILVVPFGITYMTKISHMDVASTNTNTKCLTGAPPNASTDSDDT